jgi:hypothetical protein
MAMDTRRRSASKTTPHAASRHGSAYPLPPAEDLPNAPATDDEQLERGLRDGQSRERTHQESVIEHANREESFITLLLRTLRLSRGRPHPGDPKPGRRPDERPR